MTAARAIATCLLCVLPLALGGARAAGPAAQGGGLAGTTWHTVRIDGEALFFVVREVGIRFEDGGRFAAAVRFIDGQQQSRTGTYRVPAPGTLVLAIEGLGKPKQLKFRRQGPDLVVRDHAYDVTVRLAPGKMEEERWF
jgi:hypothetical protein